MKNACYLALVVLFFLTSCNTEKLLFEKETWWFGHWQYSDDPSMFFSIGQKAVGSNEIITTQFFIATQDSIYSNFHVENLVDFNHKKEWKIMETNDNQFIKIKELSDSELELYGPAKTKAGLDSESVKYLKKSNDILPSIPDSILFDL